MKRWKSAGLLSCLLIGTGFWASAFAGAGEAATRSVVEPRYTVAGKTLPGVAMAEDRPEQKAEGNWMSVQLRWPVVPGAVRYQVVLLRSAADTKDNIALTRDWIFTNGVDISLLSFGDEARNFYWKVCPLDYDGHPLRPFSAPEAIAETGIENPETPTPTTEYDKMDYMPVYPVYSWVPTPGAKHHEVEVRRETAAGPVVLHRLAADEYDVYETAGFTTPGDYSWRVRAVTAVGAPVTDWSEPSRFTVTAPTPIAALGDSITHGGGVMSIPPGMTIYDWETYSPVPIKNIGFSGNTTAEMLDRFERDVLPFSPRVLVIMGGVNDYRAGTFGSTTVANLAAIRDKCDAYGIVPVFVTPTPINPHLMASRAQIETPPSDWQTHQAYVNRWIMSQPHAIDVASALADGQGLLREDYTTDGLHPDYFGKKYIGERIGAYLMQHFPWIAEERQKKA